MPVSIKTGPTGLVCNMPLRYSIVLCLLLLHCSLRSQLANSDLSFWDRSDSLNKTRLNTVLISEGVLLAGTYTLLGSLWYSKEDLSAFHFYNDAGNWQGVDKVGHTMTAYMVGDIGLNLMRWSGTSRNTAIWTGGTLGLVFLTGVELFDGHAAEWGFSWSDMAANILGTGLLIGQEYLWKEQRITMKWSYHSTEYPTYSPDLLGKNAYESIIKDYNGHTYWLSFNINSTMGWEQWPTWLNMAVGYGADGMISAKYDPVIYQNTGFNYQSQFYLAPDIDLRKLKVKSGFLRSALHVLNYLKFPMPALQINQDGQARFYPLYF